MATPAEPTFGPAAGAVAILEPASVTSAVEVERAASKRLGCSGWLAAGWLAAVGLLALLVEAVYQMPGMGVEIAKAIFGRQYVALQSFVAIIAIGYIAVNVAVDVFYSVLDPRIRHGEAR